MYNVYMEAYRRQRKREGEKDDKCVWGEDKYSVLSGEDERKLLLL
jgi:hypothetical protein